MFVSLVGSLQEQTPHFLLGGGGGGDMKEMSRLLLEATLLATSSIFLIGQVSLSLVTGVHQPQVVVKTFETFMSHFLTTIRCISGISKDPNTSKSQR